MSESLPIGNPGSVFSPSEQGGYDALAGLALNMRWSWNHATRRNLAAGWTPIYGISPKTGSLQGESQR